MLDWFNVYCLLHHFSVFTELRELVLTTDAVLKALLTVHYRTLAFLDETLQGFPATINLEIISIY